MSDCANSFACVSFRLWVSSTRTKRNKLSLSLLKNPNFKMVCLKYSLSRSWNCHLIYYFSGQLVVTVIRQNFSFYKISLSFCSILTSIALNCECFLFFQLFGKVGMREAQRVCLLGLHRLIDIRAFHCLLLFLGSKSWVISLP